MEHYTSVHEALEATAAESYVVAKCGDGVFSKTPIYSVYADKDTSKHREYDMGYFSMQLPKIPLPLIKAVESLFKFISLEYGIEAYAEIRWEKDRYVVDIPRQACSGVAVNYDSEPDTPDSFVVASLHSHNRMSAFFSGTDDNDELSKKLYGVFGHLIKGEKPQFLLRAGAGGRYFTYVDPAEVFDTSLTDEGKTQWVALFKELYAVWVERWVTAL